MLSMAKTRAREEGVDFNISLEDILTVFGDRCPVLGMPFNMNARTLVDASPTLDKFDRTKGYVPGNVAVISHQANRIKNNATTEQVMRVAEWMTRFQLVYDGDEDTIRLDGGISMTSNVAGINVSSGFITSTSP